MPVALRSSTTAVSSAPANAITINKPSGLANGDLLLLTVGTFPETPSSSVLTATAPAGFTQLTEAPPTTSAREVTTAFYKLITNAAGEPASYTVNISSSLSHTLHMVAGATAWTGVDQTTPIDAQPVQQIQTSLSVIAPSLTTNTANAMLIFVGTNRRQLTYTPDPAMTEVYDAFSSGGTSTSNNSAELAWQLLGAAGATGTRTATLSGATARENRGMLFALREQQPIPAASAKVRIAGAWQSKPLKARSGGTWV